MATQDGEELAQPVQAYWVGLPSHAAVSMAFEPTRGATLLALTVHDIAGVVDAGAQNAVGIEDVP